MSSRAQVAIAVLSRYSLPHSFDRNAANDMSISMSAGAWERSKNDDCYGTAPWNVAIGRLCALQSAAVSYADIENPHF